VNDIRDIDPSAVRIDRVIHEQRRDVGQPETFGQQPAGPKGITPEFPLDGVAGRSD